MDCGVPFCQSDDGCPIDNLIPEWNDLVYRGRWRDALDRLHKTNNFPEFTGRVCPAPCEGACVLGITDPAGDDQEHRERDHRPRLRRRLGRARTPPAARTGKTVAIVGSRSRGPGRRAQLNKAGHTVTVYERADRIGGLLMYGIPNMKLDKEVVERRVDLLRGGGRRVRHERRRRQERRREASCAPRTTRCCWPPARRSRATCRSRDASSRASTSRWSSSPRTRRACSTASSTTASTSARRARTSSSSAAATPGADCIGTSLRHGCTSLVNFELLDQPPERRAADNPWPQWPRIYRTRLRARGVDAKFGADPREYA